MPWHVYYRGSAEINKVAVGVDEGSYERMKVSLIHRYGYFPYYIHFVIRSVQMAGDRATALAQNGDGDARRAPRRQASPRSTAMPSSRRLLPEGCRRRTCCVLCVASSRPALHSRRETLNARFPRTVADRGRLPDSGLELQTMRNPRFIV